MPESLHSGMLFLDKGRVGEGRLSVVDVPNTTWVLRVGEQSREERRDCAKVTRKQKNVHAVRLGVASDVIG